MQCITEENEKKEELKGSKLTVLEMIKKKDEELEKVEDKHEKVEAEYKR